MLACIGLGGSAAKVAPVASPPCPAALDPALAAAPLADLSSVELAAALAAARGLCERTGGAGPFNTRVQLLGGAERHEMACEAECAAGAAERLLAALALHGSANTALQAMALSLRNLAEGSGERRRALLPAFASLSADATFLVAGGACSVADAVWEALASLVHCSDASACASGLQVLPAVAGALSACADRQGAHCMAAKLACGIFRAAAHQPDAGLCKRVHAGSHACLPPLLSILRHGDQVASAHAAQALTAMFKLASACAGSTPVGAWCSLALPAVADALSRHCAASRVCALLAHLLIAMEWEKCSAHAEVWRAAEALLRCLESVRAPSASAKHFVYFAARAISLLAGSRRDRIWFVRLAKQATSSLTAALESELSTLSALTAGAVCEALANTALWSWHDKRAFLTTTAAMAASLSVHKGESTILSGVAYYFRTFYVLATEWDSYFARHWFARLCAPRRHYSDFSLVQAALLPLVPALLGALALNDDLVSTRVADLITSSLSECRLPEECTGCRDLRAAFLSATPLLLPAIGAVASRSWNSFYDECDLLGESLALAVAALGEHCTGPSLSTLVQSALGPLVELVTASSLQFEFSPGALYTVDAAAQALAGFVEKETSGSQGPAAAGGAPADAAPAAPLPARAELRARHLPALRAAAQRLLDAPAPPAFQRLLRLLGADAFVLLHLPPLEAAERFASCLQCWRAEPRRACSGAAAHGEQLLCAICREEGGGGAGLLALHCGHVFHGRCLLAWLAHGGGARAAAAHCPLDRAPITRPAEPGDEGAPGCTLIEAGGEGGEGDQGGESGEP